MNVLINLLKKSAKSLKLCRFAYKFIIQLSKMIKTNIWDVLNNFNFFLPFFLSYE